MSRAAAMSATFLCDTERSTVSVRRSKRTGKLLRSPVLILEVMDITVVFLSSFARKTAALASSVIGSRKQEKRFCRHMVGFYIHGHMFLFFKFAGLLIFFFTECYRT
jgi:hypothetical protein